MVNYSPYLMARRRKGVSGKSVDNISSTRKTNTAKGERANGSPLSDDAQEDESSSLLSSDEDSVVPPERFHIKFNGNVGHNNNSDKVCDNIDNFNMIKSDRNLLEDDEMESPDDSEEMEIDEMNADEMVIAEDKCDDEQVVQIIGKKSDIFAVNHVDYDNCGEGKGNGQKIMDLKNLALDNSDGCAREENPSTLLLTCPKQLALSESATGMNPYVRLSNLEESQITLVLGTDINNHDENSASSTNSQTIVDNDHKENNDQVESFNHFSDLSNHKSENFTDSSKSSSGCSADSGKSSTGCSSADIVDIKNNSVYSSRSQKSVFSHFRKNKTRRKQSTHNLLRSESDCEEAKSVDENSCTSSGSDVLCGKDFITETLKVSLPMSSPLSPYVPRSDSENSIQVKVKSRWRRSSEQDNTSRSSDSEVTATPPTTPSLSPKPMTPTNPLSPLPPNVPLPVPTNVISPVEDDDKKGREIDEMDEKLRSFVPLKESEYLTSRFTSKEGKRMVCDCFLTKEELQRGEMGCGEDCLNRLLMIECGSRCPVGDRCSNKRFQRCEYGKCEVFKTEKKGFGLRALEDLPVNSFILEYIGEILDPKEFRRRAKDYAKVKNRHYYFMALTSNAIIDATMKGSISRFINHSCDPNAETQKWTVNGELRIGFFAKKTIHSGEEITFDYQLQRYGKEAQRCYCESKLCRGWIGEDPEKGKRERKERREKESRKRKEEKRRDFMEMLDDMDLEEEIEKLSSSGLKNKNHTLNLCRLMVRAQDTVSRSQLLQLLQDGDAACRRLFIDYHGLRLLWSWMVDLGPVNDDGIDIKIEILRTLSKLPIPNKTVLQDSKVLAVVEKWGGDLIAANNSLMHKSQGLEGEREDKSHDEPRSDSVIPKIEMPDEDTQEGIENEKQLVDACILKTEDSLDEPPLPIRVVTKDDEENDIREKDKADPKSDPEMLLKNKNIVELTTRLLSEWLNLKEVFRIPKKERIEQMKEHEREADRGYKEYLDKEENHKKQSYDRHRRRLERDKPHERKRMRDSPDVDRIRKGSRPSTPLIILSKEERRQLFELKVAQEEEEERQRKQQQELWLQHEERCLALGIDPQLGVEFDPQTGYPCFFDPATGTWQSYPPPDSNGVPSDFNNTSPVFNPANPHLPPHIMQNNFDANGHPVSHSVPFNSANPLGLSHSYPIEPGSHPYPDPGSAPVDSILPEYIPLPSGPQSQGALPIYQQNPSHYSHPVAYIAAPPMPPVRLPPKWKSAKDSEGRTYYYHVKTRISQWEPPQWNESDQHQESESSSESSDDDEDEDDEDNSSSSEEDDEDEEEDKGDEEEEDDDEEDVELIEERPVLGMDTTEALEHGEASSSATSFTIIDVPSAVPALSEESKRKERKREGLVQERIISPRREEDRHDAKLYKENKEKMRRRKEQARTREREHKKRHREGKSRREKDKSDVSNDVARKIKDRFRLNMAGVIVQYLNPYRRPDCKGGRITNTEDFKHLARKLTHFVMLKELKHCRCVEDLQCNDNVKHKAKDFIKKYMAKFGSTYHRPKDDDKAFTIF